ncbi:hypothetical protein C7B76_22970 [filamentous cyanobacterium CCP2]|nr:hypothetical protein C7B76_22970 [filamentous cyanobacterium CCP2]
MQETPQTTTPSTLERTFSVNQQSSSQTIVLEAGTHWICTCNQSKNSPFCDGSHKSTPFTPLTLELETAKRVEISR